MGFFDRLFGRRKKASPQPQPEDESFRQRLWAASPQSRCGVCGKPVRGLSGGLVITSGVGGIEAMLEGMRYMCPQCGFVSCFECCADLKLHKVICKRCHAEMERA